MLLFRTTTEKVASKAMILCFFVVLAWMFVWEARMDNQM